MHVMVLPSLPFLLILSLIPSALSVYTVNGRRCSDFSDRQFIYDVDYTTTVSNRRCLNWSRVNKKHSQFNDSKCRNPDKEAMGPWCYIEPPHSEQRMEYEPCIPVCPGTVPCANPERLRDLQGDYNHFKDYLGITTTVHGHKCVNFRERAQRAAVLKNKSELAGYDDHICRNYNNKGGPWCYVSLDMDWRKTQWDFCVPTCSKTGGHIEREDIRELIFIVALSSIGALMLLGCIVVLVILKVRPLQAAELTAAVYRVKKKIKMKLKEKSDSGDDPDEEIEEEEGEEEESEIQESEDVTAEGSDEDDDDEPKAVIAKAKAKGKSAKAKSKDKSDVTAEESDEDIDEDPKAGKAKAKGKSAKTKVKPDVTPEESGEDDDEAPQAGKAKAKGKAAKTKTKAKAATKVKSKGKSAKTKGKASKVKSKTKVSKGKKQKSKKSKKSKASQKSKKKGK